MSRGLSTVAPCSAVADDDNSPLEADDTRDVPPSQPCDWSSYAVAQAAIFAQYTHEDWLQLVNFVPTTRLEAEAQDYALARFARQVAAALGTEVGRWSREGTLPVHCIAPRLTLLHGGCERRADAVERVSAPSA